MGELDARMDALVAGLVAACPSRRVGRSLWPFAQLPVEQLEAGVLAVVSHGEQDYANWRGREADLGTAKVMIVGQLQVAADADPVAVERAEFVMAEEVKAFLAGPMPAPVRQCLATGFRQSGQIEFPYGWVVFECEVM